jgi:hypothetical protein
MHCIVSQKILRDRDTALFLLSLVCVFCYLSCCIHYSVISRLYNCLLYYYPVVLYIFTHVFYCIFCTIFLDIIFMQWYTMYMVERDTGQPNRAPVPRGSKDMTRIYYKDENVNVRVCEVIGHVSLVRDALELACIDMDTWASQQGWDDYDPNCLKAEYTND